jgi:succinate dehydrogenase / fumarate reductase flavoprotein subunit
LATGGAGELYRINYTTNVTTGDGYAAAHRIGAKLVGMEFTMFSPHTMMEPGLPMWYILPCTARMHAVYRNGKGEAFLDNFLTPTGEITDNFQKRYGELSSDIREVISRAIATEIFEGRGDGDAIWLDFNKVPAELWEADLPGRYNLRCLVRDFDWRNRPLRISPGAITHLGGIGIDVWGQTNIDGLFAAGEVAAPVHGSRRRGGNAFTECVVFGARAGRAAAERARDNGRIAADIDVDEVKERIAEIGSWDRSVTPEGDPAKIRADIQLTMWENAGPLRTQERLENCLKDLAEIRRNRLPHLYAKTPFEVKAAVEVESLLDVAEIVASCALFRTESRGGHFRADLPETDHENWMCHTISVQGQPPRKGPVDVTRIPLPGADGLNKLANA